MSKERDKAIFKKQLSGVPIGKDIFDRPLIEGDVIAYCAGSQGPELKLGKILAVVRKVDWAHRETTKIKIIRIEKNHWSRRGAFTLGKRPSHLSNFDNVIKIENIPQNIIDLFEGATNES